MKGGLSGCPSSRGTLLPLPAQLRMASVPLKFFPSLPPHPGTLHAWYCFLLPEPVLSGLFSCSSPTSAQSKDMQDQQGMQAGPASSDRAGSAQLCVDTRPRHTYRHAPHCLCACVIPCLPLSVGPPHSDSAQTPFLTANSYVLSLTSVCLGIACVGLHHAESMPWACLP